MALLAWNDVFDGIDEHFTETSFYRKVCLSVPLGSHSVMVRPDEAREVIYGKPADELLREALWQFVIDNAHREESPADQWRLFAVWLAAPGIRKAAYLMSVRLRFDRKDAQSELLLALLEEVRDCDPGAPGVGASVLRAAHGRAWAHARAALRERAVATVPDSPASWDPLRACDDGPAAEEQEAAASLPDAAGEATAPCPARAPAVRAAGERIGMLAQRFGLDSVAVRARYTGPGGRGERGAGAGLLRLGGRRNR